MKKKKTADASKKESEKKSTGPGDKSQKKKGVEEKQNDLPGYPHYPSNEDIMNPANDFEKEELAGEDMPRSKNLAGKSLSDRENKPAVKDSGEAPVPEDEEDSEMNPKSNADVTKEELKLLGTDELNADMGEDEELKQRAWPVDMEGKDLDVPGEELDDDEEDIGEEDEENNNYSLGGDRHEDLEEEREEGQ